MLKICQEKRHYEEIAELPDQNDEDLADVDAEFDFSSAEGGGSSPAPTKAAMEQEKRIRREIANSNERRRMQSINAGFQTLRSLLPRQEGEKLSKAAILQQTSDFIYSLEQEKARLLTQNCQLKRLLGQQQPAASSGAESDAAADSPSSARRSVSQESMGDEARPGSAPVPAAPTPVSPGPAPAALEQLRLQLLDVRSQLEQEQRLRRVLEDRLRDAEEVSVKQELAYEEELPTGAGALQPAAHLELSPHHHAEPPVSQHHEIVSLPRHREHAPPPPAPVSHAHPQRQISSPKYHTLSVSQQQQQAAVAPDEAHSQLPLHHLPSPRHHSAPPLQQVVYESERPAGRELHMHFKKPRLEVPSMEERLAAPAQQPPPVPQQMVLPAAQLADRRDDDVFVQHRPLYLSSATSRQNLNTIVEAIRHLEGDHLFRELAESSASSTPTAAVSKMEEPLPDMEVLEPQEVPLELTTHARSSSHGDIYHSHRP